MIVNPWIFYWMGVTDALVDVCFIFAFAGVLGAVASLVGMFCAEYDREEVLYKWCRRCLKIALPAAVIGILGAVFIPSEDTILMIQAAKLATTDNVELVFNALKDAMDYAVSVLK